MTVQATGSRIVADVKCYYCGHISGQVLGRRHQPLKARDFVPRSGYAGPELKPGMRLRCERCQGPVFLEDTTSSLPMGRQAHRRPEEPRRSRIA